MGYASSNQTNQWSQREAAVKMDTDEGSNSTAERKDHDDDGLSAASTASATTMSPAIAPLHMDPTDETIRNSTSDTLPIAAIGTPSTVSTAPSSDDVSADGIDSFAFEKLSIKVDDTTHIGPPAMQPRNLVERPRLGAANVTPIPNSLEPLTHRKSHRRSLSWEDRRQNPGKNSQVFNRVVPPGAQAWSKSQVQPFNTPPAGRHGHLEPWGGPVSTQARVASFRKDGPGEHSNQYGFPRQVPHTDAWRQQRRFAEQQHFIGQHQGHAMQPQPPATHMQPRKVGYGQHPSMTPPRSRPPRAGQPGYRSAQPSSQGLGPGGSQTPTNPPRSSSEILKTLLRKKACLYEPDTSRAVALVTWLVGRELALEHGYFSRQQLQTGVHSCVSKKIDSGTITRTKVNRCMQIILNSCFHYIIPRPDGSEENGESFKMRFADTTRDDLALLARLPSPWNDIVVDRETVLKTTSSDVGAKAEGKAGPASLSPQSSPRLGGIDGHQRNPEIHIDGGDNLTKRAVLLCFNENVRSAEDVFRCHNEFIRDTANASKLQLTAQEWRTFFGKDTTCLPPAWGRQGEASLGTTVGGSSFRGDYLGRMDQNELSKFRTTWCAKRYDHDHDLCGFAHVEVNTGWLRRNPADYSYRDELCPLVVNFPARAGMKKFTINKCPKGVNCECAHSVEEILYHPNFYKRNHCKMAHHGCSSGDVCPYFHPLDVGARKQSSDGRSNPPQRHLLGRQQGHLHGNYSSNGASAKGVMNIPPNGAPMLYVHPAPTSSFEDQLSMPGLHNLFRRQSSVVCAYLDNPSRKCLYSQFGDDWGVAPPEVSQPNPQSCLSPRGV